MRHAHWYRYQTWFWLNWEQFHKQRQMLDLDFSCKHARQRFYASPDVQSTIHFNNLHFTAKINGKQKTKRSRYLPVDVNLANSHNTIHSVSVLLVKIIIIIIKKIKIIGVEPVTFGAETITLQVLSSYFSTLSLLLTLTNNHSSATLPVLPYP